MSEHDHSHGGNANARQLGIALALTGTFLIVEVIYGFLSGSLALLSDAGHMLTDVMALALIGLVILIVPSADNGPYMTPFAFALLALLTALVLLAHARSLG